MESKRKLKKLTWRTGLLIFGISYAVTFIGVWVLRETLIPKEELDCYARVITLQHAVNQWDRAHPDKKITEEIDEAALVKEDFLQQLNYDHERHYYFVGETAHGFKVKCNKDEDNPLILRLTGDFLLAVLVFIVLCYIRGYVLFDPS